MEDISITAGNHYISNFKCAGILFLDLPKTEPLEVFPSLMFLFSLKVYRVNKTSKIRQYVQNSFAGKRTA